jgi:phage terminase large subunit-like protein
LARAANGPGAHPSQQREERVKRALTNGVYFAETYCAPYDPNWSEIMPPFAQDMFRFMASVKPWPYRAGVIMLPPEFMKTTLKQAYALWVTTKSRFYGQLLRAMFMSEEEGMAKGDLAVLKWHIENNERLAADFCDDRGTPLLRPDPNMDKWSDEQIIIERPGVASRDPTWQAKGLDSKGVTGRRLDLFLGDDMVTPKNASSPALRKQALDKMELEIQTRVVEGGQMIVMGNFNDSKDLLSTLAAESRWVLFRRPSLHLKDKPSVAPREGDLFGEQALETWPQVWSKRRLKAEFDSKPNRFRRIHLLDPRAEQGEKLKVSWVQRIPEEQGAGLLKYAKFYMSIDVAAGGDTEDLDYNAITVAAVTQHHIDIVQSFAVRADLPRVIDLLGTIHDSFAAVGYGVQVIGVSKATLDRYFSSAVSMKRPDLVHKMEPISVPGDKETRLEGLGPKAQSGWMRVWDSIWTQRTSDPFDQGEEMTLEEEWREFPYGNHDDRLDSIDVCLRAAQEFDLVGPVDWTMEVAEA